MDNKQNKGIFWQQAQLSAEEIKKMSKEHCRRVSIRIKMALLLSVALFIFGLISAIISYNLYLDYSVEQHKRLGDGISRLAAGIIPPERVDEFIEKGERAEGYSQIEQSLYKIRASSPDIKYVYAYKIEKDGCHVVFDLDDGDDEGAQPGDVINFDEDFAEYLPTLFAGGEIEPIISEGRYGWLLTSYTPVLDENGKCQCYAAADISMNEIRDQAQDYLYKVTLLFICIYLAILFVGFLLARYHIILPVNTMAYAAGGFNYDSQRAMEKSLAQIKQLDITTGDEIENLYHSLVKLTGNSVKYLKDIKKKNETIDRMQYAFILTLADMVESRDENTGQHIKKTAAYVEIILRSMKEHGIYADELTNQFMDNVINSAPLHDIGKISVPDAILNKPGRLTDEEFAKMKTHTVEGGKIISSIITAIPDSDYLYDACDLATYHHEWWNGRGYPMGLSGDSIPLSARIMAVADVFDALVSNRSYKKGFPYEKALGIIREESGTHFDPKIVEAFFAAQDEILRVADEFSEMEKKDENGAEGK